MNTPSKKILDQVRDYLLSQNPNHKGALVISSELIQAAERGELSRRISPPAPSTDIQPDNPARPANAQCGEISEAAASPRPDKRRRGRPEYAPPWLEEAARLMANGLTLRKALWRLGIHLSEKERKNIYRWKLFRQYHEEATDAFVAEWGATPSREVARIRNSFAGLAGL